MPQATGRKQPDPVAQVGNLLVEELSFVVNTKLELPMEEAGIRKIQDWVRQEAELAVRIAEAEARAGHANVISKEHVILAKARGREPMKQSIRTVLCTAGGVLLGISGTVVIQEITGSDLLPAVVALGIFLGAVAGTVLLMWPLRK